MVQVTFATLADGDVRTVEIAVGQTLMSGAKAHRIVGVEAVCGGAMACGTCHVYVDPDWYARLPPPSDAEREVLEYGVEPQPTSRLSCQLAVTGALDGLKVTVPETQI